MNYEPISGRDLRKKFDDASYVESVICSKVALNGPEEALARIIKAYDLDLHFLPSRVRKFKEISSIARKLDASLMIQAAHTHWNPEKPIIYRYDDNENRYIIGLHEISDDAWYVPVSFVKATGRIHPYEWVDSSIEFSADFWEHQFRAVDYIMKNCIGDDDPVGLGIDFRFRHRGQELFEEDRLYGSIEYPVHVNGVEDDKFSQITTGKNFEKIDVEYRDTLNVGWPCQIDDDLQLEVESLELLNELRDALSSTPSLEQRVRLLKNLEKRVLEIR